MAERVAAVLRNESHDVFFDKRDLPPGASVADDICNLDSFYATQFEWLDRLEALGVPVTFQGLYQFQEPKLYCCGAVGTNGFVFTPDGQIHKCGLEIDHPAEAVGTLDEPLDFSNPNLQKWRQYSPFENSECVA